MKRRLFVLGLCLALAGVGVYGASRALVYGAPAAAVPKDLPSYRDVVKRVLPAVVSIEAHAKTRHAALELPRFGDVPGLPDGLRKELERFRKQPLPEPHSGRSLGSGFLVDPSGVILTNAHVVKGADEVEVRLHDGRTFKSRDIKRDPKTDLAVVRIDVKESLPCLALGDSDAAEIGDRVLAFGAPLGLRGTVTSGIVSAKARDVHLNMYEDFIQTDAAINPGNSGGPLVNLAGVVVGINTAIRSETGGFQGIGLAISSNLAKGVLQDLRANGTVRRGYLGVQAQPLDAAVAGRLGVKDKGGVVLSRVVAGSPAARCGLQDGDVLTELNGQPVHDPRQLQRVVAGLPVGKEVELTVLRDGSRKSLKLTVEQQPESFGSLSDAVPAEVGKTGLKVTDLTADHARAHGFSAGTEGVLIDEVSPDSAASAAGLQRGMLIIKVDQHRVKTAQEAREALEKASLEQGVLLQVRSAQGGTTYVLLKAARA